MLKQFNVGASEDLSARDIEIFRKADEIGTLRDRLPCRFFEQNFNQHSPLWRDKVSAMSG